MSIGSCLHCQHALGGHSDPIALIGDTTGWVCSEPGCPCIIDNPELLTGHRRVADWHPVNTNVDHLAGCNPCQVRVARFIIQHREPPTLTVGDLRRVTDGQPDDTPVVIAVGTNDHDAVEAVAVSAWLQASDAVPVDLGGTDPVTEATRGVLFVQSWRYTAIERDCVVCRTPLVWDTLARCYRHADGHVRRHKPEPARFQLADWVTVGRDDDPDEPSRMAAWLRRRFGRRA